MKAKSVLFRSQVWWLARRGVGCDEEEADDVNLAQASLTW
jgi:hypothetical protein